MVYKYIKAGLNSVANLRKVPKKPFAITCMVTYRCNSKCKMCGIWKSKTQQRAKEDLSIEELRRIFKDPFFSELTSISIGGGEPYLRPDIADIVAELARSCKKLKNITIPSNGFLTEQTILRTEDMLKRLDPKVELSIGISLDGIGRVHDFTRGVPNAYKRAIATLKGLKKLEKKYSNFHTGFGGIVLPWNVDSLKDMVKLAESMKLPKPQFWLPSISEGHFDNKDAKSNIQLSPEQMERAAAFFDTYCYNRDFYAFYADNLRSVNRKKGRVFPCFWGYQIMYFDASGDVYPCMYLNDPKYKMGNIKTQPMDEIWFSENSNKVRQLLKSESVCRNCIASCRFFENVVLNLFPYFRFKVKKTLGLAEK